MDCEKISDIDLDFLRILMSCCTQVSDLKD